LSKLNYNHVLNRGNYKAFVICTILNSHSVCIVF